MASTYEVISTTTISNGTTSSITFSSIPSTYTHLVLVTTGYIGTQGYALLRVNSDSGTNYSRTFMNGTGSAAQSGRNNNDTSTYLTLSNSTIGTSVVNIFQYANTSVYKTILSRDNDPSANTIAQVSLWRSTSAINAISLTIGSYYYSIGTTATLYGIKSA